MDKQLAETGATPRRRVLRITLAGNPNSGKTTLFNELTGAHQHVGNYPGVTVEKKSGSYSYCGQHVEVTDLPGIYSLTAGSPEELVARQAILHGAPDVVVGVLDASNLERNLYLAMQIQELGVPMLLVLNMADMAESLGHRINIAKLSELLGLRVIHTVACRGEGVETLRQAILELGDTPPVPKTLRLYNDHIEHALTELTDLLTQCLSAHILPARRRWLAIKLLEQDRIAEQFVRQHLHHADALSAPLADLRGKLAEEVEDDVEMVMADNRYEAISDICRQAVRSGISDMTTHSDHIDRIMTHRFLGIPIFFAMMFLVFKLTFTVGEPFMSLIEGAFALLRDTITDVWPEAAWPLLQSLVVDGILGGVGGVLVFLPNILLLFLAMAILEDSGYMARAAFLMDRLMNEIGLHGKSFIPLLIGLGCTVPAIMATRTLENERDRLTTMMVAPLMSCGARLPIYVMVIPAFFPTSLHAWMLWLMYLIGIALAILCACILRSTLFKGETTPFVMEMPPYRLPTFSGVLIHMWERSQLYVKKVGTIILGVSVILWALTTFPEKPSFSQDYDGQIAALTATEPLAAADTAVTVSMHISDLEHARKAEQLSHTFAGRIGHRLEPIVRPVGFDWRICTALIGSLAAKEVFVAQMGIVFSMGEANDESPALRDHLRTNYTPLQGFCIMLFCLISAPCMATIAVTRLESNSWKWALLQLGGLTALAYVITMAVYQAGLLTGIGI